MCRELCETFGFAADDDINGSHSEREVSASQTLEQTTSRAVKFYDVSKLRSRYSLLLRLSTVYRHLANTTFHTLAAEALLRLWKLQTSCHTISVLQAEATCRDLRFLLEEFDVPLL